MPDPEFVFLTLGVLILKSISLVVPPPLRPLLILNVGIGGFEFFGTFGIVISAVGGSGTNGLMPTGFTSKVL